MHSSEIEVPNKEIPPVHGALAVAKKELRSYFDSPIAYVFLVLFLGAALTHFFN